MTRRVATLCLLVALLVAAPLISAQTPPTSNDYEPGAADGYNPDGYDYENVSYPDAYDNSSVGNSAIDNADATNSDYGDSLAEEEDVDREYDVDAVIGQQPAGDYEDYDPEPVSGNVPEVVSESEEIQNSEQNNVENVKNTENAETSETNNGETAEQPVVIEEEEEEEEASEENVEVLPISAEVPMASIPMESVAPAPVPAPDSAVMPLPAVVDAVAPAPVVAPVEPQGSGSAKATTFGAAVVAAGVALLI